MRLGFERDARDVLLGERGKPGHKGRCRLPPEDVGAAAEGHNSLYRATSQPPDTDGMLNVLDERDATAARARRRANRAASAGGSPPGARCVNAAAPRFSSAGALGSGLVHAANLAVRALFDGGRADGRRAPGACARRRSRLLPAGGLCRRTNITVILDGRSATAPFRVLGPDTFIRVGAKRRTRASCDAAHVYVPECEPPFVQSFGELEHSVTFRLLTSSTEETPPGCRSTTRISRRPRSPAAADLHLGQSGARREGYMRRRARIPHTGSKQYRQVIFFVRQRIVRFARRTTTDSTCSRTAQP